MKMDNDKFILMNLDDDRSKNIAEVLGNKTCKKILDYLSDVAEASENDIAKSLSIPINTVEYNLNKLIKSGLIDKTKNFFWSVKGKKIPMYGLSNKKILISPKVFGKNVAFVFLGVLLGSLGIKVLGDRMSVNSINVLKEASLNSPEISEGAVGVIQDSAVGVVQDFIPQTSGVWSNLSTSLGGEAWAWFLLGGLFAILIFLLMNYLKNERRFLK